MRQVPHGWGTWSLVKFRSARYALISSQSFYPGAAASVQAVPTDCGWNALLTWWICSGLLGMCASVWKISLREDLCLPPWAKERITNKNESSSTVFILLPAYFFLCGSYLSLPIFPLYHSFFFASLPWRFTFPLSLPSCFFALSLASCLY
jgi:hypothetical protein